MKTIGELVVFAFLGAGYGRETAQDKFQREETPEMSFYGLHHAEGRVGRLVYSRSTQAPKFLRRLNSLVSKLIWIDLYHAWAHRHEIRSADVIWTITEKEAFAASLISTIYFWHRSPAIICQVIWMLDKEDILSKIRRSILRPLIGRFDAVTVHSAEYLKTASEPVKSKLHFLKFGVSKDRFFRALDQKTIANFSIKSLLCPGNDKTRDWDIVLQAAKRIPDIQFTIFCPWLAKDFANGLKNVTIVNTGSWRDLFKAYQKHDAVLVPMVENRYSGITAALEAAALGVPCISAKTGGVPSYFSEAEVHYYAPGRLDHLIEAINKLNSSPLDTHNKTQNAQSRFIDDELSTEGMVKRLISLTERVLGEGNQIA